MPCPSLTKTWPNKPLAWDWRLGKPGYPLYPPDEEDKDAGRKALSRRSPGAAQAQRHVDMRMRLRRARER